MPGENPYFLLANPKELQNLLEVFPLYIALVDENYRIVTANHYFQEMFGERIGDFCYAAYKGAGRKCPSCPVEITFLYDKLEVAEETGRSKDGQEIRYLVYSAPIHDSQGNVCYAMEISFELTERKNLERKIRDQQHLLQSITNYSFCGIIALDEQGKVTVFNPLAKRILGCSANETFSYRDLTYFFPKKISVLIQSLMAGKNRKDPCLPLQEDTWLRSKGGEKIPVCFSLLPLMANGINQGVIFFFEDLRPYKALEEQSLHAARMAALGQTIASFVHGLKNMVTALEGGLYVLESAKQKKDESLWQQGWKMIEKNTEKISNLTRDLLNYSRMPMLEFAWVNLQELIAEVCSQYQAKGASGGIKIIQEIDPNLGLVLLDPKRINTCLTNLVANALEACAKAEKENLYIIVRGGRNDEGAIVLEVEDNGPAISLENQKKLFRTFFTTKGTAGTGLGLLICKRIVQEHGGNISVNTSPGEGSLFRVILPQEEKKS